MTEKVEDIQKGLAKLTWVIETHSEEAWPIFERLEKELSQIRSREERLKRHSQKFG